MKIKTTIILVFIIALIIASISGLYPFYLNAKAVLKEQTYNHLESVAESRAAHVRSFLRDVCESTRVPSTSVVFMEFLTTDKDHESYAKKFEMVNKRLKQIKENFDEFDDVCLLDGNGIIVVSSNSAFVGKNRSTDPYFIEGMKGAYMSDMYLSKVTGKPGFVVAYPILSDRGESLGVLVGRIDAYALNNVVADRSGLGETGETYLITVDGYRITASRFVNDTFLKQRINTTGSRGCWELFDEEEGITIYENYRGEVVLGTHRRIEEMNWCLLAEISEEEVLGAQRTHLFNVFLLSVFIIIICVILFSFLISRLISKPLEKLTETIEDISRGKLDVKVEGKERNDEIGDLARAFDRTLVSLKLAMKQTAPAMKKEMDELKKAIEEKNKAEKELKKQNIELIKSQIELDSMAKQMEDKNYYLEETRGELKRQIKALQHRDTKK